MQLLLYIDIQGRIQGTPLGAILSPYFEDTRYEIMFSFFDWVALNI